MRWLVAVLAGGLALLPQLAAGSPSFPYKTLVAADDVYVRSGPGQNYYPTEKLRRGQQVEVYRHDPGGWCAIRPVEGSFTWVSARYLRPTEDRLAVVTDDEVSARVGSRFSDARDVVQVRLKKGEVVELLDPPPREGAWDARAWVKIAPPSGEFRWVSAKYLDAEYPSEGVRRSPPPERSPRGQEPPTVDSSSDVPCIPTAALVEPPSSDSDAPPRQTAPRSLSSEEFQAELERIDLELSAMVIGPPASWSFDAMRDRTNQLLDASETAVQRGRARLLANKIARFDDIKHRQEAVWAMREQTDRDSRLVARLRPQTDPVAMEPDGRFDGVGTLTDVVSSKPGAPRYALVAPSGEVQCYVTPTPGVPLRNYVGRQVGVNGPRGYMPEQRAGHIMARHVTPLENTPRR